MIILYEYILNIEDKLACLIYLSHKDKQPHCIYFTSRGSLSYLQVCSPSLYLPFYLYRFEHS